MMGIMVRMPMDVIFGLVEIFSLGNWQVAKQPNTRLQVHFRLQTTVTT